MTLEEYEEALETATEEKNNIYKFFITMGLSEEDSKEAYRWYLEYKKGKIKNGKKNL